MRRRQHLLRLSTRLVLLWGLLSPIVSAQRQLPPHAARIVVDAKRIEGEISPLLYGQFLEFMFEGIKYGFHAEMLRDRGFEEQPDESGLSRHWQRFPDDRNDDYALSFKSDNATSYPETKEGTAQEGRALQLNVQRGAITRHGIFQSRLAVRGGQVYRGSLWLKAGTFAGRIAASLEVDGSDGERYAETEIKTIEGGKNNANWSKYEFELRPRKSDPLARFVITFDGRGRLWLDQTSLMPGDAVGGVRADVLERIAALRPAFIRWPGGNVAQDYRWRWGVGPRDERPTWINLSWKNEREASDFGTDEFIEFCHRIGAEPSITVNVEGRGATVAEAAAWVEYCNGPPTSKYGALRAAHGRREPYGVKYWEVGNEIWGDWVRGHSDATTYARNYNRYAAAMRAVDPTIKLTAVGDNRMDWNRTVLRLAGKNIDYLAIHHYYGVREMRGDDKNLMARPLYYERFYEDVRRLLRETVPGRDIKLNINEWGLDVPVGRQHSMETAVYGARLMNVFERTNGLVAQSAVSDLVNGWPGGIIQSDRSGVFVTPLYFVNQLYNEHRGAERLAARVEGPSFDTTLEGRGVPVIDAVASRSGDGREIYLKLVNTDAERALAAELEIVGAAVESRAEIKTIAGDGVNNFATPQNVRVQRSAARAAGGGSSSSGGGAPRLSVLLPKRSVSIVVVRVSS